MPGSACCRARGGSGGAAGCWWGGVSSSSAVVLSQERAEAPLGESCSRGFAPRGSLSPSLSAGSLLHLSRGRGN